MRIQFLLQSVPLSARCLVHGYRELALARAVAGVDLRWCGVADIDVGAARALVAVAVNCGAGDLGGTQWERPARQGLATGLDRAVDAVAGGRVRELDDGTVWTGRLDRHVAWHRHRWRRGVANRDREAATCGVAAMVGGRAADVRGAEREHGA